MSDESPRPRPTPYPRPQEQTSVGPPPGWQPNPPQEQQPQQAADWATPPPGWAAPPSAQQYPPPPSYGGYPGYGHPGHGYPQPPYGYYAQPKNGLGLAGMVCGIVGIPLALIVWGFVPSLLAVIFGLIGRARVQQREATNPGQALAGIVCGAIGMAIAVGMFVFYLTYHDANGCSLFDDTGVCAS